MIAKLMCASNEERDAQVARVNAEAIEKGVRVFASKCGTRTLAVRYATDADWDALFEKTGD